MRWNTLGVLLGNNAARFIYALPVAGYVVLYSDYFQTLFHFSTLSATSWGFLTFTARINFIYYGSWILLLAFGLYWIYSPHLLRGKRDMFHFVSDIVVARTRPTVVDISQSSPFTLENTDAKLIFKAAVDQRDFSDALGVLRGRGVQLGTGAGEYEDSIPLILSVFYRYQNSTQACLRYFISALIGLGYVFVLGLPSIDLLLRVLGTHYHRIIG
jgi:hypothetical protein